MVGRITLSGYIGIQILLFNKFSKLIFRDVFPLWLRDKNQEDDEIVFVAASADTRYNQKWKRLFISSGYCFWFFD